MEVVPHKPAVLVNSPSATTQSERVAPAPRVAGHFDQTFKLVNVRIEDVVKVSAAAGVVLGLLVEIFAWAVVAIPSLTFGLELVLGSVTLAIFVVVHVFFVRLFTAELNYCGATRKELLAGALRRGPYVAAWYAAPLLLVGLVVVALTLLLVHINPWSLLITAPLTMVVMVLLSIYIPVIANLAAVGPTLSPSAFVAEIRFATRGHKGFIFGCLFMINIACWLAGMVLALLTVLPSFLPVIGTMVEIAASFVALAVASAGYASMHRKLGMRVEDSLRGVPPMAPPTPPPPVAPVVPRPPVGPVVPRPPVGPVAVHNFPPRPAVSPKQLPPTEPNPPMWS